MDWYYESSGQQQGPVSRERLIELYREGQVRGTTLVWNETFSDWTALSAVPELAAASPPAQSPPTPQQPLPPEQSSPTLSAAGPHPATGENVPTYMWQSIVCLVLCCWPFAIPAIVYAAKTSAAVQAGHVEDARANSANARTWCIVAFVAGLLVNGMIFLAAISGAFAEA